MLKIGQKGLSIVQALVTIGLLSGIGLMTMQVAEKQALNQKNVRTDSDVENAYNLILQAFASQASCNGAAGGLNLNTVANAAGENNPNLRTPIRLNPGVRDEAGKILYGTLPGGGDAKLFPNISITDISIGPLLNAGGPLQVVDLWITYTKQGIAAVPGVGGAPVPVTKKIADQLTVELTGGAGGTTIDSCYTNGDAVSAGIIASCALIGGVYQQATGSCNLTDHQVVFPANASRIGVSTLYLENRFGELSTWADNTFLRTAAPNTMTGDLIANSVRINNVDTSNATSGLNLGAARTLLADPNFVNLNSIGLCAANETCYVYGGNLIRRPSNSLDCPAGYRMIGLNASGAICVRLLGGVTNCPAGQEGTLRVNSSGGVEFTCVNSPTPPVTYTQYTCDATTGAWTTSGTCPSGPSSLCTSGSAGPGGMACCASAPNSTCTGGSSTNLDAYSCTGGLWVRVGSCSGSSDALCTSGSAIETERACCSSAPTSNCGPNVGGTKYCRRAVYITIYEALSNGTRRVNEPPYVEFTSTRTCSNNSECLFLNEAPVGNSNPRYTPGGGENESRTIEKVGECL